MAANGDEGVAAVMMMVKMVAAGTTVMAASVPMTTMEARETITARAT